MKNFLLATLASVVLVSTASAGGNCFDAANLTVDVKTIGSCALGPYEFSNFNWIDANGNYTGGFVELVGATFGPNSIAALVFNPQMNVASEDLHLTFEVDSINGNTAVYQEGLSVSGTINAHVQEIGCATFIATNSSGSCNPGPAVYNTAVFAGNTAPLGPLTPPLSTLFVWKDLASGAPQDGRAALLQFTETFQTPEPGTIALFGAALLAFGLVRRKL
jgi:hypothetical protein